MNDEQRAKLHELIATWQAEVETGGPNASAAFRSIKRLSDAAGEEYETVALQTLREAGLLD